MYQSVVQRRSEHTGACRPAVVADQKAQCYHSRDVTALIMEGATVLGDPREDLFVSQPDRRSLVDDPPAPLKFALNVTHSLSIFKHQNFDQYPLIAPKL